MKNLWIFCLLASIGLPNVSANARILNKKPYRIVCYLGSWANYRRGDGKFLIEDIDTNLCTHLVYGFAKLNHDNKIAVYDSYLDLKENWGLGAYERFTGLKKSNPKLKVLLAIGGWNEGSSKYSWMARTPNTRRVFINSCVEFLKKYNFDGLDLDWEYPATRGGIPEDKKNFVHLLKEMKENFKTHNLMLTAAVSAGQDTIDVAYDIPALGQYLDLINLMAYDFHGGWDKTTGHNSPLYARPDETDLQRTLNVDYSVKYWLRKGAPADKLILGMPLYGRSFTLRDPQKNGLNSSVNGKGMAGEFTREQGFVGYHEICNMLQKEENWQVTVEKHTQAPYAVRERQWIGYDDIKSISAKVDYLMKMKLGGAMVWSLETDDFRGKCHGHKYPLLQAINAVLNGTSLPPPDFNFDNSILPTWIHSSSTPAISSSTTTKSSSTTLQSHSTSTEVITDSPGHDHFSCPRSGYFRHPRNCKHFFVCQPKHPGFNGGYHAYMFECSAGTVFSQEMRVCAYPIDVPECRGS